MNSGHCLQDLSSAGGQYPSTHNQCSTMPATAVMTVLYLHTAPLAQPQTADKEQRGAARVTAVCIVHQSEACTGQKPPPSSPDHDAVALHALKSCDMPGMQCRESADFTANTHRDKHTACTASLQANCLQSLKQSVVNKANTDSLCQLPSALQVPDQTFLAYQSLAKQGNQVCKVI